MSMDSCQSCSAPVDTDFDVECYEVAHSAGKCICERCREEIEEMLAMPDSERNLPMRKDLPPEYEAIFNEMMDLADAYMGMNGDAKLSDASKMAMTDILHSRWHALRMRYGVKDSDPLPEAPHPRDVFDKVPYELVMGRPH